MKPSSIKISLFFLLCVALIGTLLRAVAFIKLPFDYQHLVHTHSHVAFQGWIYTLVMLFTTHFFLEPKQINSGRFNLLFKLTVIIIICVLISFTLQGYGLYSIIFSSIFQLLNYWFIFSFFSHCKASEKNKTSQTSLLFVKTGFWLGLLSTLAPWAIGILSAKGLSGTEAYRSAVYFFLHFQYNGWFLFTALGLVFKLWENEQIGFDPILAKRFYWLFTLAAIPAYGLSLLGMSFRNVVMIPAAIAAIMQTAALLIYGQLLQKIIGVWFQEKSIWFKLFMISALVSLFLKVSLQFASIFPAVQHLAFDSKNLILAYLHLSLIGVISFIFMSILIRLKWLSNHMLSRAGYLLLITGFVVSEIILAISGMGWFHLSTTLLAFSALMALGILLLLLSPKAD